MQDLEPYSLRHPEPSPRPTVNTTSDGNPCAPRTACPINLFSPASPPAGGVFLVWPYPQGNFLPPLSYFVLIHQKENESGTKEREMSGAAVRLTPGCELSCGICTVRCATMVAVRDDLWREIEQLHRLQATQPTIDRAREVRLLQTQMATVEQEWRRLRPSISRHGSMRTAKRLH